MLAHHRALGEQLSARVGAVSAAAAAGQPHEAAVAGLIAYLAGEILPHAAAEEATIYPAPILASGADLDVRGLPPARRHESILAAYRLLGPGTSFVLVNDHDPKLLPYQFEAEHVGQFTWDCIKAGPQTWRVRIERGSA